MGLTLLSDEDLVVVTAWGLANPANPKVPHPTALIVDGEGVIRYLRQDVDYTHRPAAKEILAALAAIE